MTVFRSNGRDEKKIKTLPEGTTLYVIEDVERRVAPYEAARLCARYKVTHHHGILGGAMCGSKSAEQLLRDHGTVYTSKPKGVRGYWEPSPQVAGPLGNEEADGRPLDRAEIRGLRKRVRDNTAEQKRAKRGRWI